MNIVIITGGSKGIGKALAKKYASENYKVYSLSRSIINIQDVTQIVVDLSNFKEMKNQFSMLLDQLKEHSTSSITLINNAGRLGTISNIENIDPIDISESVNLNITGPMVLSNMFINYTKNLSCKKQIINISSGAATKPYEGWSVYCASKAALDMFTKTVAAEQEMLANGIKCISLYPGVVDTSMQAQIRGTKEENFKNLQRFVDLKENNDLYSADYVAETIYNIDIQNKLENGAVFDIRTI
ncbi:(S)-benzoin forming benzil reductase [Tenacibaculum sp. MAR_2009_124]|uniref:(S)-benzoin forming benzil reductase n=1 Tax=Tenacibaculum sp. MAR_2009_124 TaxID=1250059 RepID=UPI00115FBD2D|nr:(S)-benzoin forming benzil reductase [Tenacibaculum sp. MAR_2009_124]